MAPPSTPDGRYIVVKGRLWRATNPNLPEAQRAELVRRLMEARRAIARARRAGDAAALRAARKQVQAAKEGLGERGAVWWSDSAPDYNRRIVANSPYREWYAALPPEER